VPTDDRRDHLAADFNAMSPLDKVEWMVEHRGWAVEAVAPQVDTDPQVPGYTYSIGLPAAVGFPEVIVFGLTPSDASNLIELVVDLRRDGTEIPIGVEVTGLYDSGLRAAFAPVDVAEWIALFPMAAAWYQDAAFEVVQLLWPDRNGFMPYEPGFAARVRPAQPVIGRFASS
jgi:hypothetical protein